MGAAEKLTRPQTLSALWPLMMQLRPQPPCRREESPRSIRAQTSHRPNSILHRRLPERPRDNPNTSRLYTSALTPSQVPRSALTPHPLSCPCAICARSPCHASLRGLRFAAPLRAWRSTVPPIGRSFAEAAEPTSRAGRHVVRRQEFLQSPARRLEPTFRGGRHVVRATDPHLRSTFEPDRATVWDCRVRHIRQCRSRIVKARVPASHSPSGGRT